MRFILTVADFLHTSIHIPRESEAMKKLVPMLSTATAVAVLCTVVMAEDRKRPGPFGSVGRVLSFSQLPSLIEVASLSASLTSD